MLNEDQFRILQQGVAVWNEWREENPDAQINLIWATLSGIDLRGANLRGASLIGADLKEADLREADLSYTNLDYAHLSMANLSRGCLSETSAFKADLLGANLRGANLSHANLFDADLSGANLSKAILAMANLTRANLINADLSYANLLGAILVETNLEGSILTGCNIYGISAWKLKLKNAKQNDLVITPSNEPVITVDNLQVAQFIYLLLNNEEIRQVIDTITSKAVLILGSFKDERKIVLDAIRDELRKRNYLPVMFDFERPESRDLGDNIHTSPYGQVCHS